MPGSGIYINRLPCEQNNTMEHEIQKRNTRTMLEASSLGAYELIKATIEGTRSIGNASSSI